jgi:hypothetical protein
MVDRKPPRFLDGPLESLDALIGFGRFKDGNPVVDAFNEGMDNASIEGRVNPLIALTSSSRKLLLLNELLEVPGLVLVLRTSVSSEKTLVLLGLLGKSSVATKPFRSRSINTSLSAVRETVREY